MFAGGTWQTDTECYILPYVALLNVYMATMEQNTIKDGVEKKNGMFMKNNPCVSVQKRIYSNLYIHVITTNYNANAPMYVSVNSVLRYLHKKDIHR